MGIASPTIVDALGELKTLADTLRAGLENLEVMLAAIPELALEDGFASELDSVRDQSMEAIKVADRIILGPVEVDA